MSTPTWSPVPGAELTVTAWRFRLVCRLGPPESSARRADESRAIEIPELARLIRRGCLPQTALRIVAPLDWPSPTAEERVLS
jgi:hypothetical protein